MVCAETAVAGCQADRPICLAPLGEPPRDSRAVAILKVCLNCGRPFPPSELRTGRCHGCIKQHDAERNARPERRVWRTARWQRIRATALERDGHACADCHASNLRLDAHHITALRDGGEPFALEPRMKTAAAEKTVVCAACGAAFVRRRGRGRPRRYCPGCTPPGDAAASARVWRARNPQAVHEYNRSRLIPWQLQKPYGYEAECRECGLRERVQGGFGPGRCSGCGGELRLAG